MASKRFGPPIQAEDQRAGELLRFGDQNFPNNTEKTPPAQSKRRRKWPRKIAAGPYPLGPGDRARVAELRRLGLHIRLVEGGAV